MLAWIKQLFGWGKSRNCPLCAERDFPTVDSLTSHMWAVHDPIDNRIHDCDPCPVCGIIHPLGKHRPDETRAVEHGKGPASVRNFSSRSPYPGRLTTPKLTRPVAPPPAKHEQSTIDPFALVPLAEAIFDSTPAIDTAPTSEPTQFEGFGGGESGGGGASGKW